MRYGAVALAVTASSMGVVLLLVSLGYVDPLRLVSIPIIALGVWTLAYGVAAKERYYGVWGGLLTGVSLALILEAVTGNLLLNFSVLLIILPIALLATSRLGSRQ